MEQMAMDGGSLLTRVLPQAAARAGELRLPRFLDRLRAGGKVVWDVLGEDVFDLAQTWESDTARGWAAFAVAHAEGGLDRHLGLALRFADDPHFAVREWAWLAVRPAVTRDPKAAVAMLAQRTSDPSERVRRFCAEVTRPRGVWSAHISLFKTQPQLALAILDPLASAKERYVRDSVSNWLNDAARSTPDWVEDQCVRWRAEHGVAVEYMCRRARRSVVRK
jgi:3-methyladenine DNA glycosylase AlkC